MYVVVSSKRSWNFPRWYRELAADGTDKKAGDAYKLKHDILGPERYYAQESLLLGSTDFLDGQWNHVDQLLRDLDTTPAATHPRDVQRVEFGV